MSYNCVSYSVLKYKNVFNLKRYYKLNKLQVENVLIIISLFMDINYVSKYCVEPKQFYFIFFTNNDPVVINQCDGVL